MANFNDLNPDTAEHQGWLFLYDNTVVIAGKSAGIKDYCFNDTGTKCQIGDVGDSKFKAHTVPMLRGKDHVLQKEDFDPKAIVGYMLPAESGDVKLMVTGGLSGCSFVVQRLPGTNSVLCAHIEPRPGEDNFALGVELQTYLEANAQFQDQQRPEPDDDYQIAVYGAKNYGQGEKATVMGFVDQAGKWRIFGQSYSTNFEVKKVEEISPL